MIGWVIDGGGESGCKWEEGAKIFLDGCEIKFKLWTVVEGYLLGKIKITITSSQRVITGLIKKVSHHTLETLAALFLKSANVHHLSPPSKSHKILGQPGIET